MSRMPRKIYDIDEDLIRDIQEYRFENRIPSETEAARRLLRAGLDAERERIVSTRKR